MKRIPLVVTVMLAGLLAAATLSLGQTVKELAAQGIEQCNDGKYDQAISTFNQALKQNPKDATLHFYRGRAYYAKRQFDRALADLNEALKLNPAYGHAYFARAMVYVDQEKFEEAVEEIHKAARNGYKDEDFLKLITKKAENKKRLH